MTLQSRLDSQAAEWVQQSSDQMPLQRQESTRASRITRSSGNHPDARLAFNLGYIPSHIWTRLHDRAGIRRRLRLSLTDHCNYNCFFCHNEGQGPIHRRSTQLLEADELFAIARVALAEGVTKIKLTGGEPLLYNTTRDDIVSLVSSLSRLRSESASFDFSLTTNGSLLAKYATRLRAAGLDRATISLTTLNANTFKTLIAPNAGLLERSISGLDAARSAGLVPVKLNAVLYHSNKSYCGNLDELHTLIETAAAAGVDEFRIFTLLWHEDFARFDEFYQFFSARMREQLTAVLAHFGIPEPGDTADVLARLGTAFSHRMYPKVEFGVDLGRMKLGFEAMKYGRLTSEESGFQEGPYAIRVAADGAMRSTLSKSPSYDLINAVRRGALETELRSLYNRALEEMP
jgi:molybdenum cofactor biosynthesis enzyme MoaA